MQSTALYNGVQNPNVIMIPCVIQVALFPIAPKVHVDPRGIGTVENPQPIEPIMSNMLSGNSKWFWNAVCVFLLLLSLLLLRRNTIKIIAEDPKTERALELAITNLKHIHFVTPIWISGQSPCSKAMAFNSFRLWSVIFKILCEERLGPNSAMLFIVLTLTFTSREKVKIYFQT